jgi:hypothetical protein
VKFFASAQDEVVSQAELARVLGKRAAIDEFGAGLCQRPLSEGWKILVELASENELQDGISQELQPLVGLHGNALFVCHRRVGQSEPQQRQVVKCVTKLILEIVVIGHGAQKIPNSNSKTPKKSQIPTSESGSLFTQLTFGSWDLFGIWSLGFGIFIRFVLRKRAGLRIPIRLVLLAPSVD